MKSLEKQLYIPENYRPKLALRETEIAIKQIKDCFERTLAETLNLTRVSSPLFVFPETGLNDNLNGTESPVSFTVGDVENATVEIVHSLAKWKRMALQKYGFSLNEGLYTDMNAIRKDEVLDNLHSIYVDQWDWEKVIQKSDRNMDTLRSVVKMIFDVFRKMENYLCGLYPQLERKLPGDIYFISSQELEDRYPELTPKGREDAITKEKKAVFVSQIGGKLRSGERHDGRAPDYDDWSLNGDILFWNPVLEIAFEVSSMGIRVDEETLERQLEIAGCQNRKELQFHRMLLEKKLPYTIGGGIGQSRICMYFLESAHIGEVQVGIWHDQMVQSCKDNNINLL